MTARRRKIATHLRMFAMRMRLAYHMECVNARKDLWGMEYPATLVKLFCIKIRMFYIF